MPAGPKLLYRTSIKRSLADVIVVDQPMKGCDEELLNTIASMKPKRVVYVFYDQGTLARNLKTLSEKVFTVKVVRPVDIFFGERLGWMLS